MKWIDNIKKDPVPLILAVVVILVAVVYTCGIIYAYNMNHG